MIQALFSKRNEPIIQAGRRVFNRRGPLQPQFLTTLLLYQARNGDRLGYARMLDSFWDEAQAHGLELPRETPVTAQAFCDARQKLPSSFVRHLLHDASDLFDDAHGDRTRWNGRRLLAVDGERRFTRPCEELSAAFGGPEGAHYPQCHVSALFDVIANVPLDAVVGPYGSCERRQLARLLDRTRADDILVLDRGYPGFDILAILVHEKSGRDFVVRVPMSGTFKGVDAFVASGETDADIVLEPPRDSLLREIDPITLRIVRIDKPEIDSEPWILLTTLGRSEFSVADLGEAYNLRWRIESFFGLLVSDYFTQGYFHAKSVNGIEQEIYAQMLFVAITRYLMAAAADSADVEYDCVSQKGAIIAAGENMTRLLLRGQSPQRAFAHLEHLLKRMSRVLVKPRPGRSYPRVSKRPGRRWGPQGRRSGA